MAVQNRRLSAMEELCCASADICHVIISFVGIGRGIVQLACTSSAWREHVRTSSVWEVYAARLFLHEYAELVIAESADHATDWMAYLASQMQVPSQPRISAFRRVGRAIRSFAAPLANPLLRWWLRSRPRLLLTGIENSGVTTAAYKLNCPSPPVCSIGMRMMEWSVPNARLCFYDDLDVLNENHFFRMLIAVMNGVAFVVDANCREGFENVSRALGVIHKYLKPGAPVLVLANKQDLPQAQPAQQVVDGTHIQRVLTPRCWYVQPCSAIANIGLQEGMEWLIPEALHRMGPL